MPINRVNAIKNRCFLVFSVPIKHLRWAWFCHSVLIPTFKKFSIILPFDALVHHGQVLVTGHAFVNSFFSLCIVCLNDSLAECLPIFSAKSLTILRARERLMCFSIMRFMAPTSLRLATIQFPVVQNLVAGRADVISTLGCLHNLFIGPCTSSTEGTVY